MGIANLSSALSLANTQTDFGVAMLSKTISLNEKAGSDIVNMMERSVNPNVGQNIDVRA